MDRREKNMAADSLLKTTDPMDDFPMKSLWIDGIKMESYNTQRSDQGLDVSIHLSTDEQKKKIHDLSNIFLDNRAAGLETFFELRLSDWTSSKSVKLVGSACSGEQNIGGLRLEHYQAINNCKLVVDL
jgi:hypothetical protein